MARFLDSTTSIKKEAGKKKKKQETTQQKQTAQSPSYSQKVQQTNQRLTQKYGGGGSGGSARGSSSQPTTQQRQNQKSYGQPTQPVRRNQAELQRQKEERRQQAQDQKMGLNSRGTTEQRQAARRAVRNTPAVARESARQAAIGHGKTAADITAATNSSALGSRAEFKSRAFQEDIEKRRSASTKAAEHAFSELTKRQERSEKRLQKLTKNAKGVEKAYYGALESGIGMATDALIGAGTGQAGALTAMASRTYGLTRGTAQKEGATENEDRLYSLAQGLKEAGTELMFPGAGLAKRAYGRAGLSLAEKGANLLTRRLTGKAADVTRAGLRLAGGVGEENLEEVAGWGLDPLIKEFTYGRRTRERDAEEVMKRVSNNLRSNIKSEEDAQSASAYLSSPDFIEETKRSYMQEGMSEADAAETAEKMRDYLAAGLSGDTATMTALEDEVSKKIAKGKKLEWDRQDLKDTIASTTLLTGVTGLPGTLTTTARGAGIRDALGDDGVRALANTAIDFEDETLSYKGQAARDRIDSGKSLTATQVYDLAAGQAEQERIDRERSRASRAMASKALKDNDLVSPFSEDRDGNITDIGEATGKAYNEAADSAVASLRRVASENNKESLTDRELDRGRRAIAGFKTGVFTVNDANELNFSNGVVREAFKAETGIDLDQYIVRDKSGNVNIPATNTATKNALFAMATDNLVQSAEAETVNWMDTAKGETVTQVSSRMGAEGSLALQKALDDVDERDRSAYMMTANAADMLYQTGRNMGVTWDSIKDEAKSIFPDISEDKLRSMYEAGLADKEAADSAMVGLQIKIGEKIKTDKANADPKGNVLVETEVLPKGTTIRVFSEIAANLGVDIHLVDDLRTGTGNQANGQYIDGNIYINVNSDFESNLGYIFMHEVTHHLKLYAPEQYHALENLVREKWFDYDASQMQNEIAKRIDLYARNGQKLTEEQALEEIIADAAHEFITDRNFANQVAEDNPSLAKAILDSIRNALRMLRRIFANGEIEDQTHMNSLFSQIGILSESEELWLSAYKQAAVNRAAVGIEDLQNRIYEEGRPANEQSSESLANEYESERFSLVTDPEIIKELEADEHVTTYRGMVKIGDMYYSPMSSKVRNEKGKYELREGIKEGDWVKAEITTDPKMFYPNGDYRLMKDNGKSIPAAYNPYMHSSTSMMNDQFSTQYKRPNLVVIEGVVPKSELENGYRVEHDLDDGRHVVAKDPTGKAVWKPGPIEKDLPADRQRTVYLSNHFKMVREVPVEEVAQHIHDKLEGTDVALTYNVVTPKLRQELLKLGTKMKQNKQDMYKVELDDEDLRLIEQNPNATRYSLDAEDGYNIKDGKARWTDDRIDYIIRDNSEKFTNKTHAWATMINPRDFLKLTLRDEYLDKWNESAQNVPEEVKGMSYAEADEYVYQKFRETGEWIHDNENYPLDEDELRNERTTPFLKILQVGNSVNVDGHEGRHRMRALMEAGVESVPVLITTSGRNEKSKIKSLTLRSQDYGFPGPVNNGATVTVGDLVPVTEDHRNELVQKFGGDAQVRFSITPEQQETIEHNVGPDVRFSVPTWRETLAKAIFNSSEGFSAYSGKQSGMQITYDLTKNNFSEEQAKAVTDYMDMMAAWFEKTGEGSIRSKYKFIGWDDLTKAEVQVRKNDKNEIVSLTVSAMVKNGEYPVNFDLTTVCNKREGFSEVIKNLIDTKVPGTNENVLNTIKLTDKNMWKINQALKAEGIDTACLGCFVEARRYYAQNFMNKIDDKWNNAVRKARRELGLPEEEYFNFAKGKEVSGEEWSAIDDLWSAYDESKESKSSPADRIKILMDEIVKNKETDSPYLKLIQMSDISTPEGYNAFKQLSTKGHDMVKTIKSIYGTSAPKEILAFTPYNSEIALLPENMKGMPTGDYLRSIGGIRVQSFSDFKIEHVFDHFQMVADEAARKFVTHGYSKVIAFPRIFGLTGRKINMSVMFDVLPNRAWSQVLGIPVRKAAKYAKKYQGLQFVKEKPAENPDNRPYIETEIEGVHGYLTYLVSDTDYVNSVRDREYQKNLDAGMSEDEARRKANEAKPFEQSINYKDAVELENQDGYKENIGIIAVAYGDEHLKVLMSDPNVRYIIPYHKSGLPTFISKKTSLAIARDYTNFQNTNIAESWKDANGKEVDFRKEFNKFVKEHKDEKYPAIEFFKHINDNKYKVKFGSKTASQKSEMAGTADFDVYKDLDSVKDIREVSNAYLEHCIKNGWCPVFHEFAGDPNYYKMIFDFAVTDGTTTNIYPQRAVRNNYPGLDIDAKVAAGEEITEEDLAKLKEAVEIGAKEQNDKNMIRSNNMGNVMNDLLSRDTENSIIADTNLQSIRWNTPDYTDVKLGNEEMTPEETDADVRLSISVNLDDDYMDAVNSGNMEEAQKYVDEAAKVAGFKPVHRYHGTMDAGFTVFDKAYAKVGGNSGAGFYFSTEEDDSINHYQDVEGADNYFKWSELAEHINSQINEGEWEGPELETYEDVEEYAKEQLNKNPGTYDVYLNYKNPYVRDFRDSTNIYDILMGGFDESVIDRDDYENEDDYEEDVFYQKTEHIAEKVDEAIRGAIYDLESFYDYVAISDVDEIISKITEQAYDFESVTWDDIQSAITLSTDMELANEGWDLPAYGTTEFTRAIIENFGFDAIEDKEVSSKFGQLSREMMTDTEHIIVFKPEQIKLSDTITYAEDGSVIPLSERFDPNNNDIRYSLPTTDADGNILTDGQMEYFKNSQARDEKGRLVRVFHSTDKGGFTVFDPMESNDHRSLFFTSLRRMSESYIRTGQKGDINPYEENAVIRSIKNVDELPEFISDEVTKRARDNISNIRVVDNDGGEVIAEGDDFVEVAKSIVQHLEQRGIDAEEDLMILPDILYDDSNPAQMGEAWEVYNELRSIDGFYSYTMDYADHGDAGTYTCYLNLENPLIIDARGHYWNDIPFDERRGYYKTRELAELAQNEGFDGVIIHNVVDYGSSGYGNDPADVYIAFSSNQVKDTRNENPSENPDIRYSVPDEDELIGYLTETAESMDDMFFTDPELEEGRRRLGKAKADFIFSKSNKWNERWLTKGLVLDEKKTKRAVREAVMSVMSKAEGEAKYKNELVNEAMKTCKRAFYLMKIGKFSEAGESIYDLSRKMVEENNFFDDTYEERFNDYVELRKYIRARKFYVPDLGAQEYAEHRKADMGKIWLCSAEKGTSIEEEWDDLCRQWPEWFDIDEAKPTEMLFALEDAIEAARPMAKAYCSEEAADYIDTLANQLYDIVYEGDEYQSIADKYKKAAEEKTAAMKLRFMEAMQDMQELKEEHRAEIKDLKATYKQNLKTQKMKYEFEIAELKQNREYNIQRLKAEKTRAVKEERRKSREKQAEKRSAAQHRKMLERITDKYNTLCKWVLEPTKEKNVPEEFRVSLAEFLQTLDLQTYNSKALEEQTGHVAYKTFRMRELKDRLNALAASKSDADGNYTPGIFEVDAYVGYLMESLSNKLDGKPIDALDNDAISDIDTIMKAIIKNIQRYKEVKLETKNAELSDIGDRAADFFIKKRERDGVYGKHKGALGALETINATALTPAYLFDRMGPFKEMYDVLRHNGFDTYIRNEKMITDKLTQILSPYYNVNNQKGKRKKPVPGSEVEKWRDDRSAQTIELSDGNTVTMTAAQMMSLYCLNKRGEQALGHMLVGGILVTPIQTGSKIEAAKEHFKRKADTSEKRVLAYEDVQTIISKLTPDQIKVADQLQELMSVDMAKLGNEAHRELYGYEMFNEPNYFPIKVHGNERSTDINTIGEVFEKIKSFGFTKPLTPQANKAIEIDDIFSVVADHCNGMNLYNAYLVPITDFMKVFNYTYTAEDGEVITMKEAIEQVYGKDILKYILNMMKDINGIRADNRGGLEGIMNSALGTAKKTAVFGNIRVALQQPTAIVRAFAEVKPKYFTPHVDVKLNAIPVAQAAERKAIYEEMYKYCPIAQWKAWGYYDTYMGRDIEDVMMNNYSMSDVALSGLYGALDNMTWSAIWQAVKSEQEDLHPGMDFKSDEFLQICGRRASEVFDKTQVVDSTFHRSDAMRNKQVAVKAFTAFMSEPTLTLNVFRAGLYNFREEMKTGNKAEAYKILGTALGTIAAQAIVVSAAQAVADAWRGKDPGFPWDDDDDDKDKDATYKERFYHNLVQNIFDQLHLENNMYLVKDVTPYINYMISKGADHWNWNPTLRAVMGWDQDYLYSQNNLIFAGLENTANGIAQAFKKLEKGEDYDKTWYDVIQKSMSGIGTFTGIPVGTLMRDFHPIWDKFFAGAFAMAELPTEKPLLTSTSESSSTTTTTTASAADDDNTTTYSKEKPFFGLGKSDYEKHQEELEKERQAEEQKRFDKIESIKEKTADLEGEAKARKIWSSVTKYMKDEEHNGKSLKEYIHEGDFYTIEEVKTMYMQAGGSVDYFNERMAANCKSELKKTISSDNTEEQVQAQQRIKEYMLNHGVTEAELSEIAYNSRTAKQELKIAFRINDHDAIVDEMTALIQAGISRDDLYRIYDNRNRIDIKKYKESGGKYADRLKSTGVYNWPINGSITSRFGHRSSPGGVGSTNHQGLDIAGSMGDPVGASDGGTVVYAGWYGGAGKTVMIEHDDGTVTQYSHLSWYDAQPGDIVAQGQYIGKVGSTGNSTGPHLHFGVKVNGVYQDPETYLANR